MISAKLCRENNFGVSNHLVAVDCHSFDELNESGLDLIVNRNHFPSLEDIHRINKQFNWISMNIHSEKRVALIHPHYTKLQRVFKIVRIVLDNLPRQNQTLTKLA